MQILKEASADLRQRLLELFPVATLRAHFTQKGSKEDVAAALAASADTHTLRAIADFVDENLPLCKQHIYIFSHDGSATFPSGLHDGELVKKGKNHALYLVKITYTVVQLDPLKYGSIDFLWPIRIDLHPNYVLVRFVVMEKSVSSYFQRDIMVRGKSLSEEGIAGEVLSAGTLSSADLNKGFKALWQHDRIDATRIRYKKPGSTVTQSMDEEKGLKQVDPSAYEELRKLPLYQSVFIPYEDFGAVGSFTADPTHGFIGFTRYFKEGESGDELIEQILKNN